MPTFRALSYGDKRRVRRCLVRGEAPRDQQTAAAAIELAERYQREGRVYMTLMRWLPGAMVVVFGFVAIPAAIHGDKGMAIVYALIVLVSVWHLTSNPATRPKKMAQSLEAARRRISSGD